MTERAAIYTLQMNRPFAYSELQDAVDMAISALEMQEKLKERIAEFKEKFKKQPWEEYFIGEVIKLLEEFVVEE